MGRPINRKWFGKPDGVQPKIVVNAVKWLDGTTATDVYILRQVGTRKYIVSNDVKTETVTLVNASDAAVLKPGEAFVLAKVLGGAALPCQKIAQYRLNVYNPDGTIGNYSWGTHPANRLGQADLLPVTPAVAPEPTEPTEPTDTP